MSATTAIAEVQRRLDADFRARYGVALDDLELAATPGYWQRKEPCGGLRGGCRSELHRTLFNEGGVHHTVSYFDPPRVNGRFASPYRTWRAAVAAALARPTGQQQ